MLEGERRGKNVVHGEGDKSSVPEAHFAGVVEDSLGGEVIRAAHERVWVVLKMVAAPEPVKRPVDRTASMACVDTDACFNVERAVEAVAGGGASGGDAGGAARSIVVAVFVQPLGDVANGLCERGTLLKAATFVVAGG